MNTEKGKSPETTTLYPRREEVVKLILKDTNLQSIKGITDIEHEDIRRVRFTDSNGLIVFMEFAIEGHKHRYIYVDKAWPDNSYYLEQDRAVQFSTGLRRLIRRTLIPLKHPGCTALLRVLEDGTTVLVSRWDD